MYRLEFRLFFVLVLTNLVLDDEGRRTHSERGENLMVVRQVEEGVPYCLERRPVIAALAVAGIAGPLLFVVVIVRQSLLHPDYSQVKLPISALAAWPGGWVQNVNFVIFGLLMISCKRASDVVVREAHRSRPFPYRRDDRCTSGGLSPPSQDCTSSDWNFSTPRRRGWFRVSEGMQNTLSRPSFQGPAKLAAGSSAIHRSLL